MADMKENKKRQSRREFYGFESRKRDPMDYVFWLLCILAVVLLVVVGFTYL
ncbi:MAG: hypothetical protein IJ605_01275 [Prevotella sp.]|nr:hypothetical protein [Prevotella sp.]